MSITDELREWAQKAPTYAFMQKLPTLADRIDVEHEKAIRELNNLADSCVLLPKDANGEVIHIGDVLTDDAEFKSEGKVVRLMLENGGWMVSFDGCAGWTDQSIHEWHHYHKPTVEDVLREFTDVIVEWERDRRTIAETGTWSDVAADFIAKLQLKETE